MSDLFLIFNHQATSLQEADARRSLGATRIIDLPRDLKALWRQIPAELDGITEYLEPVMDWLGKHAKKGKYVLVQGDFGACFIMVDFAFKKGLIPVYSTSQREALDEYAEDGTIKTVHHFKHRIFRRYGV